MKTQPKQLLGYLPLDIPLPGLLFVRKVLGTYSLSKELKYQKQYICKFCKFLIKLKAKHYLKLCLIKLVLQFL